MALLLSVACVCVASEETKEAESLRHPDPLTQTPLKPLPGNDGCPEGNTGPQCNINPERPETATSACAQPAGTDSCVNKDRETQEHCTPSSKSSCSPKEPAGERAEQAPAGVAGELGEAGPRQGSGTHTGDDPGSSSALPNVSPPSQSTTLESGDASQSGPQDEQSGGNTTEESGANL
ncbi:uncharacterized protein TM35_000102980 [Trypanosoma theileri]|uniref:Mucin-associated surface protein (MASP) n=1 Tax=Trypanosoma theileri TaxID=67003 RepID=A0A1X0P0T8_9TRYP|nr:uncharacterized protein TM35_000102980 [Trypanosoma theileri]ORC90030.1 hypothetical protein TM35_000102980 [Trypanosoma theileri]